MIETNITKRWEQGVPHHSKSVALFKALSEIDWLHGGDFFGWKSGGDGDNGEHLMYEMDIYFETLEQQAEKAAVIASLQPEPSFDKPMNVFRVEQIDFGK